LAGEAARVDPGGSQAASLIAQAQSDARNIRRQAEDDARKAALAAADEVLDERVGRTVADLTPALRQAVDGIVAARTEWLAHWERTAVRVAAAIAERVVRRQLDRAPQITLDLVREALELATGAADVRLRLHPDDYQSLGRHVEQLKAELSRLGKVDVTPDPSITRGGCRVDTRFGTIDQQFEAQLERIEQELV
jgi:flagellar biosynthesis/type III secretory pathway protein FliH